MEGADFDCLSVEVHNQATSLASSILSPFFVFSFVVSSSLLASDALGVSSFLVVFFALVISSRGEGAEEMREERKETLLSFPPNRTDSQTEATRTNYPQASPSIGL